MIRVLIGNLFDSGAQTLVNTVNTAGVMGKGIALEFKNRYPDMYEDYVARCRAGQVKLGQPYLYRKLIPPWIINFPTKDHWRSVARLEDVVRGICYLEAHYKEWGVTSVAVPPLGCGEGQLEWRVVGPTLYRHLSQLEIDVELYAPWGTPATELDAAFLAARPELAIAGAGQGRVRPGWVALVEIVSKIENEPYHWPVGRTTFQKIAYFATEKGIPTGLSYSRGSYGPYSADLKNRLTQLVNNGLICEEQLGEMFAVKVGPTFKDALETYRSDIKPMAPVVERVADLFLRMNTRQSEIAATVHYSVKILTESTREKPTEQQVLDYIMEWKQKRRPPLDQSEVARTIRNLAALGWIDVKPSTSLPLPEEAAV